MPAQSLFCQAFHAHKDGLTRRDPPCCSRRDRQRLLLLPCLRASQTAQEPGP